MANVIGSLRKIHGSIYERKLKRERNSFYQKALRLSKRAEQKVVSEEDYPVDFVVTWVDGNDPVWQAERNKYSGEALENEDSSQERFREWGTFKYWFRSIEKNAPWVNCIYLVTYGHIPEWLNVDAPKLKVISHRDFIPEEYLPTFSSHTIEWNLWRIPGLSEHYVYFNDDMYLLNPVKKSDFFLNGLPRYTSIAQPMMTFNKMAAHRHARLNNLGIINSYFDIRRCMENHPEKWFNVQYAAMNKYNQLAYEDGYISGMYFNHLAAPYRKSAMLDFCNHYPDRVHETCVNRFRTSDDIMHQVVQMWEMFNGTFEPIGPTYYGQLISPIRNNIENAVKTIGGSSLIVCINDHPGISQEDFEYIKKRIIDALDQKFSEKSSFEI